MPSQLVVHKKKHRLVTTWENCLLIFICICMMFVSYILFHFNVVDYTLQDTEIMNRQYRFHMLIRVLSNLGTQNSETHKERLFEFGVASVFAVVSFYCLH